MEDNRYGCFIGRTDARNIAIFDFLKPKIRGHFLDVGTNIGILLSELPDGVGIDLSKQMVDYATKLGLNVIHATATSLPFEDCSFDTVVMSCVLEQIPMWQDALDEAIRVCNVGGKVIGLNPIPDKSIWGRIGGGSDWVKSVIPEEDMKNFGASIEYPNIEGKYYFEINKKP